MLRMLFGEAPRVDTGELLEAMTAMDHYLAKVRAVMEREGDPHHDWRKIEVWTVGLKTSLDELEQSMYASARFASLVTKQYQEEMNEEELDNYYRHVYFYKNGFIRLFSVLDKVGTLLNEALQLETGKVKNRFSFFTVLRQMNYLNSTPALTRQLMQVKDAHKDSLQRLRKRRNTEIHHMNAEMQDDLWQRHRSLNDKVRLENIQANVNDLKDGYEAVCQVLITIFTHLLRMKNGNESK
ncbi:Cthe_2314 family HEPN domain-containing protein [Paenibacillus taiwanensis]|uniref:Cthe_2314 family HEPN domain-containing protein n=1 Tax=Paenibacillus taiwanensis TaxID=401638 RepID=UPI0003FC40EE|nr:Cthe_2314 family HEPN domain-containing protein [Paenibacillus taiwanensis]